VLVGAALLFRLYAPPHQPAKGIGPEWLWIFGTVVAGILVHELGHVVGGLLVRRRVSAIYLGAPPGPITIKLGSLRVHLGLRMRGEVQLRGEPLSPRRNAIFLAAGSAANLASAPLLLLLPLPRWEAMWLAAMTFVLGLENLVPFETRNGTTTDGMKLWQIRPRVRAEAELRRLCDSPGWTAQPGSADMLIRAYRLGVPSAIQRIRQLAGKRDELLSLHLHAWKLPRHPLYAEVMAVNSLTYLMLAVGDVPPGLAAAGASRLEWALRSLKRRRSGDVRSRQAVQAVQHSLAVARLRQGRPAEVEPLCRPSAATNPSPRVKASVLATVALARHALGQSGADELAEAAVALAPHADLVPEAVAAVGGGTVAGLLADPAAEGLTS
jgi:hypothetical protein